MPIPLYQRRPPSSSMHLPPPLLRRQSESPIFMTSHIRICYANGSDHAALAEIGAQACTDDPMDAYLYPHRREHPEAYRKIYLDRIKYFATEPLCFVVVAKIDPVDAPDSSHEKTESSPVVGYALFCRETEIAGVQKRWEEGQVRTWRNSMWLSSVSAPGS